MTIDRNKGIQVAYNELNLPATITFANGNQLTYQYGADGEKLAQNYTSTAGVQTTRYVAGFVYGQGPLLTVPTPVGRALYGITSNNSTRRWIQEYHIRDHLGNLRLAFRNEGRDVQRMAATMEQTNAEDEEKHFDNLTNTREFNPAHARTGNYAARLNAGQTRRMYGPSTAVQVSAGDSVHFEVYGRYDVNRKARVLPAVLPIAAIANEPTAKTVDGRTMAQRGFPAKLVAGIALAWSAIPHLFEHQQEVPRASLKYDLYDQDSNLVASQVRYLDRDAANEWQKLQVSIKAEQKGYILVSLQNATSEDVWFDDALLRTTQDMVVQENHYDPWGQNLTNIEYEGAPSEQWQYANKEKIQEQGLEWVDHGSRYYDPQLGRWHTQDPADQFVSPYSAMADNPVMFTDPDGEFLPLVVGVAFVIGGGMNLWQNIDKVDGWKSGAAYFLSGGVGGAVSVFNPVAGGAITATANVGIDVATGHLPNFNDPMAVLKYAGSTALSGLSAGGAGSMARLTITGVTALTSKATWSFSNYVMGSEVISHAINEAGKEVLHVTTQTVVVTATQQTAKVAATSLASSGGAKLLGSGVRKFAGDEAIGHFAKHGNGVMNALGKSSYNLANYVDDANHVLQTGTYVPELNGYVKLIGGPGSAKYAFVGLTRNGANITTFHIKTVKQLASKALSLGLNL